MAEVLKSIFLPFFYGKRSEISEPHEKFRICFCGKTSSGSVEWYLIDVSVEKACLSGKTESSIKKLTPISVAKHFPSVYYAALGGRIYCLGGQRRSEGGGETLLKDVLILDLKFLDGFSARSPAALSHWKPAPAVSGEDQGMKSVLLVEDEDDEDWKSVSVYSSKDVHDKNLSILHKSMLRMEEHWRAVYGGQSHRLEDRRPALRGKDWIYGTHGLEDQRPALRGMDWIYGAHRLEDQRPDLKDWISGKCRLECRRPALDWIYSTHRFEDQRSVFGGGDWDFFPLTLEDQDKKSKRAALRHILRSTLDSNCSHWKEALLYGERKTSISALALASEDWKPATGKAFRYLDLSSRSISALSLTDWYSESIHVLLFREYMKSLTLREYIKSLTLSGGNWKPGPPMTFARCNPHTMVVDDKLYVIGGFQSNQKQADGWIEFFDPEEETWESLPNPPDLIHSSVMLSGLLKAKKEIIIARQRWDRHPILFYSYNIKNRSWNMLKPPESKVSVCLPPNIGRAVTVDNTLYWISTEEHNHECIIRSYDLDRNMWFEDRLNTATIFGRREHFSSIYSSGPGFLHLGDQKFCLLLQSTVSKNDPQSSIQYLYCVILDISPISEDEDRGKFELTTLSVQKYSMDHYINFLDCMLVSSE